jgi:hypothetical protein
VESLDELLVELDHDLVRCHAIKIPRVLPTSHGSEVSATNSADLGY